MNQSRRSWVTLSQEVKRSKSFFCEKKTVVVSRQKLKSSLFDSLDIMIVAVRLTVSKIDSGQRSEEPCMPQWNRLQLAKPRAGSGVVRMDPLRFLAGCRKATKPGLVFVLYLSMFLLCCCLLGPLLCIIVNKRKKTEGHEKSDLK